MADPLATLRRLRHVRRDQARRALAEALNAEAAAAEQATRCRMAIACESAVPAPPGAFAAWLPLALAAQQKAAAEVELCAENTGTARQMLAEASAAAEAVATALGARDAACRRAALRRAEHARDDLGRACRNALQREDS